MASHPFGCGGGHPTLCEVTAYRALSYHFAVIGTMPLSWTVSTMVQVQQPDPLCCSGRGQPHHHLHTRWMLMVGGWCDVATISANGTPKLHWGSTPAGRDFPIHCLVHSLPRQPGWGCSSCFQQPWQPLLQSNLLR